MKRRNNKNSQSGIALVMSLLALLVLSTLAVGLAYMASIETKVNGNYRSEQVSYFAAKAGMEEARDRMMLNLPGNYYFANLGPNPQPTSLPTDANQGVLYILNEGTQVGTVQPWTAGNAYMDDEICHDGYTLSGLPTGTSVPAPDVHCTSSQIPTGANWYTTTTSQLPFNGTAAAVSYKWARIALKLNGSVQNYLVNSGSPTNTPICWNGATEVPLNAASCQAMAPKTTPVYLITTLAVSSTGARKMVQAEVALNPSSSIPYGLFGTGTGCGDVTFSGNGHTDSYDSSKGTYAATQQNTGGDIGSNGNVSLSGNGSIGGSIGVLPSAPGVPIASGPCPGSNYSTNGNAGMVSDPNNTLIPLAAPIVFPVPPPPNPLPPTTSYNGSMNLVPGTYGSISVSGKSTLTLAPGVYNINSLQLSGQSSVVITPLGQVVLNIAGTGGGQVLDLSGNSVNNQTLNANQFLINYSGNGSIHVTGNASTSYFVLNAPNASVSITGNGDIFGAVVANTIQDSGNGGFHYDKNVNLAPASSGALQLISFRHVAY